MTSENFIFSTNFINVFDKIEANKLQFSTIVSLILLVYVISLYL